MSSRPIAVFGSSEPTPGDPLYDQALELGRLLGERRYTVLTGGYGGVMEAVSRGARDAGATAIGVTCETFVGRAPNRFLSRTVSAPDLHLRQRELIDRAGGFIVLAGRAGTLAELSMLWALNRAGCLDGHPVILLGLCWSELVELLCENEMLEKAQLDTTHVVPSPAAAVEMLDRLIGRPEER